MTPKRSVFSALLSIILVCGLMPLPAFAESNDALPETEGSEEVEVVSNPAAVEGATEEEAPESSNEVVQGDLESIAFVYIESPSIALGATENIVIGFVDEEMVVEEAQIEVTGPNGLVEVAVVNAVEGALLFSIDSSSFGSGAYEITALRYRDAGAGAMVEIPFSQDELSGYSFEVIQERNDLAENGVTTEVLTITNEGEYVETGSIGEAMAAAGVDPESGPSTGSTSEDGLSAQANDGFVIVLDPGHGGNDGGASGIGFSEKDVNLRIALYCKAKLEQTPGVTVYMTRSNDATVSLQDRVDFAVNHNADLVVSLHNNAGGGSGAEVIVPRNGSWYYEETYVTGTELGNKILSKLNALGLGTHSGVYSRDCTTNERYPDGTLSDYYSLIDGPRWAGILGIIVEHAFVDNSTDAAFLNNDASLKRIGEADAEAIIEYYDSSAAISRLYWGIYDNDYYLSHNADVNAAHGSSMVRSFGHFKMYGMSEGRRGNILFDVNYYKANNSDLQKAYGNDLPKYYEHFLNFGMSEGRQGSADFSPSYYRSMHSDLSAAFGTDWIRYYRHYIMYGISEGRAGSSSAMSDTELQGDGDRQLYRLFNARTGEHHYTLSSSERSICISKWGWTDEGVAWSCPATSSTPVYRLFNPVSGLHHYTTSSSEKEICINKWGWRDEGTAWYSANSSETPVYRLFHPGTGHHHYTLSAEERDICIKQWGWIDEGTAWYGVK